MAVQYVDIAGTAKLFNGTTGCVGTVIVQPRARIRNLLNDDLLMPVALRADLDSNGILPTASPNRITVVASDSTDISPSSGLTYRITENIAGVGKRSYNIAVPAASPLVGGRPTLDLGTVSPLDDIPELVFPDSASAITVSDEGVALATAATTIDFTGAGVTASGAGATKTVNVPGTPSGGAGGVLSGTYPNPGFAVDMAEQSELAAEAALARNADNLTSGTVADARIPATIARDSEVAAAINAVIDAAPGALDTLNELAAALGDDPSFATTVTNQIAAEAVLARNADNLTSGTVADARIAATIARDSEVTTAVNAEATLARNADNLTSGTVADARIASTIARDSEVTTAVSDHAAAADPHAGYVLESLIDAAGDLLVGTADNTVGRLAKGSALQELRVNAAGTALEYATPPSPTLTPYIVRNLLEHSTPTAAAALGANGATFSIAVVEHEVTVNGVLFRVDATAGNVEVGIYAADGTGGGPGTRLVTSGSVACPAVSLGGAVVALSATTLTPGKYFAALAASSASATFMYQNVGQLNILGNLRYNQSSAFPLPNPAVGTSAATNVFFVALVRT